MYQDFIDLSFQLDAVVIDSTKDIGLFVAQEQHAGFVPWGGFRITFMTDPRVMSRIQ
jgi:hypothetical protein